MIFLCADENFFLGVESITIPVALVIFHELYFVIFIINCFNLMSILLYQYLY